MSLKMILEPKLKFILFNEIIIKDISLQINQRDRIGLVGNNGAGKTTLLRTILGLQKPDSGTVESPPDLTTGYLPQQMRHRKGKTLYRETLDAFSHVLELKKRIDAITTELGERTDHDSDAYLALIQELSNTNEQYEILGGHTLRAEVEQTLTGLGFESRDMDRPVHEFSGGWRMRVELAKILLRRPDYILLDEPTNHLTSSRSSGWNPSWGAIPEGS